MVRKTGSQLRDSLFVLTEATLAMHVGDALRSELGASRRATKTVMRWAGVSDNTARSWLHGKGSPSGLHLIALAANSRSVMSILLELTGYRDLEVVLEIRAIEASLEQTLAKVRSLSHPT